MQFQNVVWGCGSVFFMYANLKVIYVSYTSHFLCISASDHARLNRTNLPIYNQLYFLYKSPHKMLTHLIVGLRFNTQHVQEKSHVHKICTPCVLLQKVNILVKTSGKDMLSYLCT